MAARRKTKKKDRLLTRLIGKTPESLQIFIAHRIVEVQSLILLGLGGFVLLSLLTYTHSDPSLNTSSNASIQNMMGQVGAQFSDLFLQTVGLAAYAIAGILIIWSIHVYRRHYLRPVWGRIVALLGTVLFASMVLARIPAAESWPLGSYYGGSAGVLMLNGAAEGLSNFITAEYVHYISAGFAAIAGIFCLYHALAFNREQWSTFFRNIATIVAGVTGSVWMGWCAFRDWLDTYAGKESGTRVSRLKLARENRKPLITKNEQTAPIAQKSVPQEPTSQKNGVGIQVVQPKKTESLPHAQPTLGLTEGWEYPSVELLQMPDPKERQNQLSEQALQRNAEMLMSVLNDYNVQGDISKIHPGPVVTLYELEPAPGTKSSRVIGLSDDIARSMSAISVRVAVIPGRNVIGIELPNVTRETVYMRELLVTRQYEKTNAKLPLVLGKDIGGHPIIADLARMPHLLVAGTTGSGKSVAINTMLLSMLYRLPPEKCRLIMIDPKMLELSVYDDIPHLLSPVVTEPGKAVVALKWTVQEMENRYRSMSKLGVRNIEGYNARLKEAREKEEVLTRKVQTGFDADTGKPVYEEEAIDLTELPYIVVVVDEFADLMVVAGKEVEGAIQRLAQMARAAGIHIIMATQRPSVDVITGTIKANFPTRISFQVTSKIDSRTILGEGGAETLLGMGDMLYMAAGGRMTRVHGPFVSDAEVESVVDHLKAQGEPLYLEDVTEGEMDDSMKGIAGGAGGSDIDELYDEAVALVAREGKASTSFVQRHLQIGYNRAARIIEHMEKEGVISKANHVGKREVLVQDVA